MWNEKHLNRLNEYLSQAQAAGGAARIDKQHQSGKYTARERMEMLFDAALSWKLALSASPATAFSRKARSSWVMASLPVTAR